jgi:enoyl-CoA hydratase
MSWTIERDGSVAVVWMGGTKANAQNEAFFADLHEAFDRLEAEFADCSVVLTAHGPIFSAGIDFESAFAMIASADHDAIADWVRAYQATNLRLWRYPRPTIAAINGHAYAGGMITALDCDYRIAVDAAQFSLNEVTIGIAMPAVYVEIIRYALGSRAAALSTLFGQVYSASEARDLGIVHTVTAPDRLLEEANAMARAVPTDAFAAYAYSKQALQAPAEQAIREVATDCDQKLLPAILSSDASVRLRAARYREVKGRRPTWARDN